MMSFSFDTTSASISAMCLSVAFWISVSERFWSSSVASLSLTRRLMASLASRRRLRMAILAFSPSERTILVISLRRSSLIGGIGTRIRSPMLAGFRPRSLSRMAFSIFAPMPFSHGCTLMVRASSSDTLATCDSGTWLP